MIDELKGQKGTLETRLSALAVQLAECESAKQRLDKTPVRVRAFVSVAPTSRSKD